MHYEDRDADGAYVDTGHHGPGPDLMGAGTLIGDPVRNLKGEHLGQIREIMLDTRNGTIAYAVMAHGGVFRLGAKLFAVPWQALTLDPASKGFTLNIDRQRLDQAPGFDPEHWPNMADPAWAAQIHRYYASPPDQGAGLS